MRDGEEAEQRTEQGKQRALTKGRLPADSPALPLASPALICSHPLASNVTGCALLALLPPCGAACGQLFLPAPSRSPISAAVKCLQCQMTTAMQRFASRSAGRTPAPHLQINKSGRTQFNVLKPFCPLPATAPQHPQTLHFRAGHKDSLEEIVKVWPLQSPRSDSRLFSLVRRLCTTVHTSAIGSACARAREHIPASRRS